MNNNKGRKTLKRSVTFQDDSILESAKRLKQALEEEGEMHCSISTSVTKDTSPTKSSEQTWTKNLQSVKQENLKPVIKKISAKKAVETALKNNTVEQVNNCIVGTEAVVKKVLGIYRKVGPFLGRMYTFMKNEKGAMIKGTWKILKQSLEDVAVKKSGVVTQGVNKDRPYTMYVSKDDNEMVQGSFHFLDDEENQ